MPNQQIEVFKCPYCHNGNFIRITDKPTQKENIKGIKYHIWQCTDNNCKYTAYEPVGE